jgi:hypothetical protein
MRKATQHYCCSRMERFMAMHAEPFTATPVAPHGHINRKAVTLRTHDALNFGREDSKMEAKFAVGDRVDQSPRDRFVGTVKAVYTTREGATRYAVDMEGHGTLRLCSEHTIVAHNH